MKSLALTLVVLFGALSVAQAAKEEAVLETAAVAAEEAAAPVESAEKPVEVK
ncbi:MAG TPA: hypothetical protein VMW10_06580 [Alphaproteobacteria bacterium]|nr:hypothetical protein [Alphaproteobacteria bacterium]